MDDVFEQSKKFFALPLEEKMKVLRNEKHRGYTPVLDEILDPENQVNGDHKEGYYIGIEVPKDDPDYDKPFYGPNPWPDSDVLPQWRETMEKYHQEALRVSKDIGRLLALALDLDANYFDTPEMLGKPIATMRLLHYEGVSDPSRGIYACGAHTDYGMLTLLATDGVMGLQVLEASQFFFIQSLPFDPTGFSYEKLRKLGDRYAKIRTPSLRSGNMYRRLKVLVFVNLVDFFIFFVYRAYIVNLGDMLERWSNGFFKSTLHRVLGNGQERYSVRLLLIHLCLISTIFVDIPFFVEPNHECLVECLPTCKSESNVPK
ncbi:hypothetical protein DY000_02048682 [Brassica cretica]|nr:hypothetical protein DY000_02048682 [Brassica cretica]